MGILNCQNNNFTGKKTGHYNRSTHPTPPTTVELFVNKQNNYTEHTNMLHYIYFSSFIIFLRIFTSEQGVGIWCFTLVYNSICQLLFDTNKPFYTVK